MQVAFEVYSSLHPKMPNSEVWDMVLEHLFFDLKPAIEMFRNARKNGHRIPLIILDDAGTHLSKYMPFVKGGFAFMKGVKSLFDVIRSLCAGTILTSPKLQALKPVQELSWFKGKILQTQEEGVRIAKIWEFTEEVWGAAWHTSIITDKFWLYLPSEVRTRYEEKRGQTVDAVLDEVDQALTKTPRYSLDCCEVAELFAHCGSNLHETARRLNRPPSTVKYTLERHKRHANAGDIAVQQPT